MYISIMKRIILILALVTLYGMTINCYHTPQCEDWQEHRRKVTKLPPGGLF